MKNVTKFKWKVVHFTTVHPRSDIRIRVKEVATLARCLDADVRLYVQDGLGDEAVAGYRIVDTGVRPRSRPRRMTLGAFRMYRAIRRARPDIAHFHDPELLPWAILLRLQGIKVIYDVHEDVPKQLLHSGTMPLIAAKAVGKIYLGFEWVAQRVFNGCIVVVPDMVARFRHGRTILLANFPSLMEFPHISDEARQYTFGRFVYAGGLAGVRGVSEMVDAVALVGDERARLHLLGVFGDSTLEAKVKARAGWKRTEFLGWSSRDTVVEELSRACAGLVLLHPTPQYLISYPVKMFEYMAAGLPVIASDFPLWREIVEGAGCGLLVDPHNPQAIADAMQWILDHPQEAAAMGRRGRAAVEERYNWEAESEKLVALYRRLLTEN